MCPGSPNNELAAPVEAYILVVDDDLAIRELVREYLTEHDFKVSLAESGADMDKVLGADIVVIPEVDSVQRQETGVRVTRRPARTTRGVDTAYVLEEGQARMFSHATFVLIDQNGQWLSDYLPVTASASGAFTRARYAGDYRTLDLGQAERDLFARGSTDDLARSFVDAMSPQLAQAVYAELLRRIP